MQSFWVDYLFALDAKVEKIEDWSRLPVHPLVSVAMITFNHEPFIAKALDGILMQEVDFDYEVVIGEDHSTDRTREIVEEYQNRHPDKIRLRLARENLYSQGLKPGIGVRAACRGRYIAVIEGDDYWTDKRKLQKQVALLDSDPDIALVHTNVMVQPQEADGSTYEYYGETNLSLPLRNPWPEKRTTLKDIARQNFIATCSVMYRAWPVTDLPEWFARISTADYAAWLLTAKKGCFRCMPDITGVYRQHGGGIMSGISKSAQIQSIYETNKLLSRVPELKEVRSELKGRVTYAALSYSTVLADEIHRNSGRLKAARQLCRDHAERLGLGTLRRRRMMGFAVEYAFQRYVREGQLAKAVRLMFALLYYRPSKLLRWSEVRNCIIVAYRSTQAATPA